MVGEIQGQTFWYYLGSLFTQAAIVAFAIYVFKITSKEMADSLKRKDILRKFDYMHEKVRKDWSEEDIKKQNKYLVEFSNFEKKYHEDKQKKRRVLWIFVGVLVAGITIQILALFLYPYIPPTP